MSKSVGPTTASGGYDHTRVRIRYESHGIVAITDTFGKSALVGKANLGRGLLLLGMRFYIHRCGSAADEATTSGTMPVEL